MQHIINRRGFLRSAAGTLTALAALRWDGVLGASRHATAATMNWFALNPEYGAGVGVCPADPTAAHAAGGDCHACKACHKHAANKLFATADSANLHRAHTGCHCTVVVGGSLPEDVWTQLFGPVDQLTRDSVDRRWDWVQAIFGEDTCGDTPDFADATFAATWKRTDKPVADGAIARTWMWGPQPFTCAGYEEYAESPGQQRLVQYFDKSRMEITHPDGDPSVIWYVTNGLLVVELITGKLQKGDNSFDIGAPANENVAGDADDPTGPTYATFANLLHVTAGAQIDVLTTGVHRDGSVYVDDSYAAYGIGASTFVSDTQHWIADPFWEFMNSSGLVYDGDTLVNAPLFVNPYYATGFPITDPYWAIVKVGGTPKAVLMQCFERRCLTYTPDNPPGFQTEAGNVGQHYHRWRYGS